MDPSSYFKLNSSFITVSIATVLFSILLVVVKSSPIVFESDKVAEEDMNKVNILSRNNQISRAKRAATAATEKLWEFGVIPYVIDESVGFDYSQKALFREAMDYWERVTCLQFVEQIAAEHDNFIRFTVSKKCACCTVVGKKIGGQDVSIGDGCDTLGIILHELGHAIGFEHEHNRPDRDQFISIHRQNIEYGREHNFRKLTTDEVDSLGEPYDFDSIMHYEPYAFSTDKLSNPTIQVNREKSGQMPNIGQRNALSEGDIRQTNKLYKCPECVHTFHGAQATFTSPNYNGTPKKEVQCEWRIAVPHGEIIQLTITDLDMYFSLNCTYDYLEVRDGYWHKSPLLGRFCHNGVNFPAIISTGNRMIIKYVAHFYWRRGFAAQYTTI